MRAVLGRYDSRCHLCGFHIRGALTKRLYLISHRRTTRELSESHWLRGRCHRCAAQAPQLDKAGGARSRCVRTPGPNVRDEPTVPCAVRLNVRPSLCMPGTPCVGHSNRCVWRFSRTGGRARLAGRSRGRVQPHMPRVRASRGASQQTQRHRPRFGSRAPNFARQSMASVRLCRVAELAKVHPGSQSPFPPLAHAHVLFEHHHARQQQMPQPVGPAAVALYARPSESEHLVQASAPPLACRH